MTINITLRWAGPGDAASGSRYKIERALTDWATWSTLAAAQAATSPYASLTATLAADADYGDVGLTLNANSLSAAGYGWLDDALVQWTGKSGSNLTGVTWHSGYGSYPAGSTLYEAHESYTDSGVDPSTCSAVVYRISHIDPSDRESPPAYCWYYYPDVPASKDHCVVIVAVGLDLGMGVRDGVTVTCGLATDDQFADLGGAQLDKDQSGAANSQTTNELGLAFFHCWKSSARGGKGGAADAAYTFVLDAGSAYSLAVTVATVPDRDWVLLKDVGA